MTDPISSPVVAEDQIIADQSPKPWYRRMMGEKKRGQTDQESAFIRKQNRERNELSVMLGTEEGQSVFMRILHECHIYDDAILDESAQGKRQLGIRLIRKVQELGSDSYANLLINHAKRQTKLKADEDAIAQNQSNAPNA